MWKELTEDARKKSSISRKKVYKLAGSLFPEVIKKHNRGAVASTQPSKEASKSPPNAKGSTSV